MNAIILAAGMGTRLRPETEYTPKPLLKIGTISIVERQIICLNEIGVDEIYVVAGYHASQFDFLRDKYKINIITNSEYRNYSNVYSFSLCKEIFGNSWVLEGDVFLSINFLESNLTRSTIFGGAKRILQGDGTILYDDKLRIRSLIPSVDGGLRRINFNNFIVPSGVSYWRQAEAKMIIAELERNIVNKSDFAKFKSWDYLYFNLLSKMALYLNLLQPQDWVEIDCKLDLLELSGNVPLESRFR